MKKSSARSLRSLPILLAVIASGAEAQTGEVPARYRPFFYKTTPPAGFWQKIGRAIGWYQPGEPAGFVVATIGAIILLFLYRMAFRRPVT